MRTKQSSRTTRDHEVSLACGGGAGLPERVFPQPTTLYAVATATSAGLPHVVVSESGRRAGLDLAVRRVAENIICTGVADAVARAGSDGHVHVRLVWSAQGVDLRIHVFAGLNGTGAGSGEGWPLERLSDPVATLRGRFEAVDTAAGHLIRAWLPAHRAAGSDQGGPTPLALAG